VGPITWCKNAYDAAEGADCVVLLTEWNEYRDLDFNLLRKVMRSHNFVDCRNVYDPRELREVGIAHAGVGWSYEAAAPWALEEIIVHGKGGRRAHASSVAAEDA
jgi:hypothetical protein